VPKCTILDIKSITIITISNLMNSESFTMKSTLIVFHYILGTGNGWNSPSGRC